MVTVLERTVGVAVTRAVSLASLARWIAKTTLPRALVLALRTLAEPESKVIAMPDFVGVTCAVTFMVAPAIAVVLALRLTLLLAAWLAIGASLNSVASSPIMANLLMCALRRGTTRVLPVLL